MRAKDATISAKDTTMWTENAKLKACKIRNSAIRSSKWKLLDVTFEALAVLGYTCASLH